LPEEGKTIMGRLLATAASLSALAATPALAQASTDTDPAWMWRYGWGMGGMMFGGGLVMLVFWGGLIVFGMLLVRWLGGVPPAPHDTRLPPRQSALDILQERYARGEIDKQEYEERRRTLMST
jgi:putative membrane protein